MANKLKPYCEQAHRQNFNVWSSNIQHVAWLSQTTPYAVDYFLATAGFLVKTYRYMYMDVGLQDYLLYELCCEQGKVFRH